MSRIAGAVFLLLSLASTGAWAAKQLIIDVEAENRPRVPRTSGGKTPNAPPPAVAPELLLGLSENETAHNLAQGIVDQLTALGYVLAPEVEYGRPNPKKQKAPPKPDPKAPPKPPDPKFVLRIEIVRMSGSCFVTGKAAEFKTQDITFFKYDTKDDTLPCTDQLKLCVAEFNKVRPPDKTPPGPDAGAPPAVEADALADKHPKLVLAPTLLNTDEPAALGAEEPPDAAAAPANAAPAPAAEPAKKKGCGCASATEGMLVATAVALLAPLARRRRP
ncbi:MAG TPA: MYXO-CTERM sorting domain-containing protein [Myxococcales bacterium]|jgi:MYXO-CTERM domain-containing protein